MKNIEMTDAKQEAIANADAHLNNAALPTYSEVIDALRHAVAMGLRTVVTKAVPATQWACVSRSFAGVLQSGRLPHSNVVKVTIIALLLQGNCGYFNRCNYGN